MLSNGVTQRVIADTLGVSLRTVAYRIGIMKAEFPSLYSTIAKSAKSAKECKQMQYNENVNVNVNENENVNVNENENENENVKVSAEGLKKLEELDKEINDKIERVMEEKGYKLVKDFDASVDRIQIDNEYRKRKKQILAQY